MQPSLPVNSRIAELIFMAAEPIPTPCLLEQIFQSVYVSMYVSAAVTRQQLSKNFPLVARPWLGENITVATNTQEPRKNKIIVERFGVYTIRVVSVKARDWLCRK
jgi:hypothetical protein